MIALGIDVGELVVGDGLRGANLDVSVEDPDAGWPPGREGADPCRPASPNRRVDLLKSRVDIPEADWRRPNSADTD